ncbi:helix-turn-helix transcriptional regulator [Sphingomonas sp. KR3-1]|uniref:helix-turn-helix transcriptional regulator n=1 Tax=Sphingomonas sp. KR3-1 TaxID=3156611 RepID=UPI0032B3DEBC
MAHLRRRVAHKSMDSSAFDRLTERQKECLRLVAAPANSKRIARELGISSHTVDEHIRGALATLAVSDRMEAARAFLAYEGGRPPQMLSSQSGGMAAGTGAGPSNPSFGKPDEDRDATLPELPAPMEAVHPPAASLWPSLPFPTPGRMRNDLDRTARLFWIGAGIALLILTASLYLALAVRYSGSH